MKLVFVIVFNRTSNYFVTIVIRFFQGFVSVGKGYVLIFAYNNLLYGIIVSLFISDRFYF